MTLGTRSVRCACLHRPPTPPLLSRCSCGFPVAHPPLMSAARSGYKIEATQSLDTFQRCGVAAGGSALVQHDPHRPLKPWPCAQARPKMTGPCPDRPYVHSLGGTAATACPADAGGASRRPEFAAAALRDVAHRCSSRQARAELCAHFPFATRSVRVRIDSYAHFPVSPAVTADPPRPSDGHCSPEAQAQPCTLPSQLFVAPPSATAPCRAAASQVRGSGGQGSAPQAKPGRRRRSFGGNPR